MGPPWIDRNESCRLAARHHGFDIGRCLALMALLRRVVQAAASPNARRLGCCNCGGLLSCLSMDARDRLVTATPPNIATICFTLAMYVWFTRWPLATRCLISAVLVRLFRSDLRSVLVCLSLFCGAPVLRGILPRRDLMITGHGSGRNAVDPDRIQPLHRISRPRANKTFDPNGFIRFPASGQRFLVDYAIFMGLPVATFLDSCWYRCWLAWRRALMFAELSRR